MTDTEEERRKATSTGVMTFPSVKALWWQLLKSLAVPGSVLVGGHNYDRYRRRKKESHFH